MSQMCHKLTTFFPSLETETMNSSCLPFNTYLWQKNRLVAKFNETYSTVKMYTILLPNFKVLRLIFESIQYSNPYLSQIESETSIKFYHITFT